MLTRKMSRRKSFLYISYPGQILQTVHATIANSMFAAAQEEEEEEDIYLTQIHEYMNIKVDNAGHP